ncbi:MAG TPA: hypothetical protein VLJ14_12315 [Ktedonobacterales bacterium]|jgi:hypothetical protein|nr:hypothetical protein [Ktedonobacterales bacterium]
MATRVLRTYQALLTRPESFARVYDAQRVIERAGGKIRLAPTATPGIVTAVLELPPPAQPGDFLPGLPFYPA